MEPNAEQKAAIEKATALINGIAEDVKSMKIKGKEDGDAQEAKLKAMKEAVEQAVATHKAHDTSMEALKCKAEEIEKAVNNLDLRTKDFNIVRAGLVDGNMFRKLHKEAQKDMERCAQTNGAHAVTMKMKVGEFNAMMMATKMRTKAAGNMTEAGNLTGDFVIEPDRLPGFFAPPLRPIHIREFINQAETSSNLINYTTESAYTDGSGSTAQGAAAGQSDFTLIANQMIVQKINAYFTMAKEMLEDTPVTENYIRTRGVARLLMFEDTALLTGNGAGANQYGILPVASAYLNPVIPGTTPTNPPNYYDVLHQAVTQAKVSYYTPNVIIIHPNDYNTLALTRDNYGRYQFPQMVTGQPGSFYVNGALVVQNTAISQGTFLVGDWEQACTLFFRQEIEITFSNQHVDNFVKGFITVMVEERLGQAIYRPTAFVTGTFNQAIISGS